MLFVTVAAARWLETEAADLGMPVDRAFRLGLAVDGGLVARPDGWSGSDHLIRGETRPLLILDEDLAETLDEALLDLDGEALSLVQARASCEGEGCVRFQLGEWARSRS